MYVYEILKRNRKCGKTAAVGCLFTNKNYWSIFFPFFSAYTE